MSLYRRKNKQKEEFGSFYYLFYVAGKRYKGSTGTLNRKVAERIESRKRVAAENGESLTPRKAPLLREVINGCSDWEDGFLKWNMKTNKALKTKADYRNGCRLLLKTDLAGMRIDQIAADEAESTVFLGKDKQQSPYTTNSALRTLSRILHKAKERKLLNEAPTIKRIHAPRRDRMVTDEDEKMLMQALEESATNRRYKKRPPSPLNEVLMLMIDTGLRPGIELVRMRIEHINWEGCFYFIAKGKTPRSRRVVPLSERVLTVLRRRCGNRREGWVYPSNKAPSGHIELRGLQKYFRRIARQIGIPEQLKLYCARHTFGTVAMAETRNPALVQDTMGHEDIRTTMEYQHQDVSPIKLVMDRRNANKPDWATAPITAPVQ
jgi:integrase